MTPSNHNIWLRRLAQVGLRLAAVFLIAVVVGWLLNRIEAAMERRAQPAGFARGLVQGALMPMSMPNLVVGHDITIYSQNNTGISYKLGYTAGVNVCGAIFFGLMFWRVSKLRAISRGANAISSEKVEAPCAVKPGTRTS
jgi:hypothetical protein